MIHLSKCVSKIRSISIHRNTQLKQLEHNHIIYLVACVASSAGAKLEITVLCPSVRSVQAKSRCADLLAPSTRCQLRRAGPLASD